MVHICPSTICTHLYTRDIIQHKQKVEGVTTGHYLFTLALVNAVHAPYFRPYHVQLILAEELVLVCLLE